MKKDIKEKWVAALRSGEYKQGKDALMRETEEGQEFCCLGVLCDLAVQSGLPVELGQTGLYDPRATYDLEEGHLPRSVREWAGLDDRDPRVRVGSSTRSLSSLNDRGTSFRDIARLIEEQL